MSAPPKFRNQNKLTDEELSVILETDTYNNYLDYLEIEDGASDNEETDIVTETDEVNKVLQVSDSENKLADSTDVEYIEIHLIRLKMCMGKNSTYCEDKER